MNKLERLRVNDALSDIFHLIRLKSCVYFQRDFFSPWAMRIEGTGHAQFHVVTRGNCVVIVDDQPHRCSSGDILFFPDGQAHTLADQPGRRPVSGAEFMASLGEDEPFFSKGENSARIICGHYEYHADLAHPLLFDLPKFIHLKEVALLSETGISSVLPLLMREFADTSAGSSSIVERYAEVLLIQVLRAFSAQTPRRTGFLSGLADTRLVRAVDRIHCDFAKPLELGDLAREAALSRSAFSQRFKETTGIAPIEYLAKWRMLCAADLLTTTDIAVSGVSERVGYESEIAFGRAFKREFGTSPSHYRREQNSVGPRFSSTA